MNDDVSPRYTHVSANSSGDSVGFYVGISNQGSSQPTMTNVMASASGNSSRNVGVEILGGSTTMIGVTASGSRNPNTGVQIDNGSATIRQSKLSAAGSGQDLALANEGGSAKIAVSQLVGGIQASGNSVQCFDNYDENMASVNCRSAAP